MTPNPFTARSGVDPKVFVGRDEELAFFKQRLLDAIHGRCQHYVITGTWGIGKTVLLRQMKLLAQTEGAWASLFSMRRFAPHEGLGPFAQHVLQMAGDALPVAPRPKRFAKLRGMSLSVMGTGMSAAWQTSERDPQLVLRDGLVQLCTHAHRHHAKAVVLLMDDIHNLAPEERELTLLRNVLTDERVAGRLKLLVIVASIEQGWHPFLLPNHPVGRLFMPRRSLPLFSEAQTLALIDACLQGTGVQFDAEIKKRVYGMTRGHVFEIQALCENLFDQQLQGRVTLANWETALRHTLFNLAAAQFDSMVSRASDQERAVLEVLARHDTPLGPHAVAALVPGVKNAAQVLKRLADKELVTRVARGRYMITDPLFAEYIRRHRQ